MSMEPEAFDKVVADAVAECERITEINKWQLPTYGSVTECVMCGKVHFSGQGMTCEAELLYIMIHCDNCGWGWFERPPSCTDDQMPEWVRKELDKKDGAEEEG